MKENYKNIRRWSSLTADEREVYGAKCVILESYLEQNVSVKLSWEQVNTILGLPHLYRWTFDRMNEDMERLGLKLNFDDEYIWTELTK